MEIDAQDPLVDMSADEVLAYVEDEHAARQRAGRNILRAAYQWAVLHHPDRLPPQDRRGRERARVAGGEGTPMVTEYAAAAFGARIQTTPARHVAQATRDLTAEEAAWVDGEVAESADGRLSWARFEALVEGKVAAAAPELARQWEQAAARDRFVRISRVNKHGMATLTVHADLATVLGIEAGVDATASKLEETMPGAGANDRRIAALALLTNPGAHVDPDVGPVRPRARIVLHLAPDSPIARVEGHGPVTREWVEELVGRAAGVRVAPVIDLANQAPVDDYEIPAALREAVHLIHPADVFPFAASTSRKVDLDHAVPWSDGGPTAVGNLGPLTRTHHRIKTHGGWQVRHPFPGIVIWRDPHGAFYLVDPTGTRRVTGTPGDQSPTPARLDIVERVINYVAA